MIRHFWILAILLCLTCLGCKRTGDPAPSPDASSTLISNISKEKFEQWARTATDESTPVEERQAALGGLTQYAMEASQVEVKRWGTVRKALVDEKSADVLRRLATTSEKQEIRAQAVEALGKLADIDSMDHLLAALENDSLPVRSAAIGAIQNILSTDFGFRANDSASARAEAITTARQFWAQQRNNTRFIEGLRDPVKLEQWKREAHL